MSEHLTEELRQRWIDLIRSEGYRLGLSNCTIFLENKYVNDIFFDGTFKGKPCIVKCSSKAPDSIKNEYDVNRRLWLIDPIVFPEPYALYEGPLAFVVTEKLVAGTATNPAGDLLRIDKALEKTGIVHRDILINLFPCSDGHLRLIDFQFAVDRNNYCESSFMRKNWKYLYTVFGVQKSLFLGCWNDCVEFLIYLKASGVPSTESSYQELQSRVWRSKFNPPLPISVYIRVLIYMISLLIQWIFALNKRKRRLVYNRLQTVLSVRRRIWLINHYAHPF